MIPPKYVTTAEMCGCADFKYRGHIRPCKHIGRLKEATEYVAAQEALNAWAQENGPAWQRESA